GSSTAEGLYPHPFPVFTFPPLGVGRPVPPPILMSTGFLDGRDTPQSPGRNARQAAVNPLERSRSTGAVLFFPVRRHLGLLEVELRPGTPPVAGLRDQRERVDLLDAAPVAVLDQPVRGDELDLDR